MHVLESFLTNWFMLKLSMVIMTAAGFRSHSSIAKNF